MSDLPILPPDFPTAEQLHQRIRVDPRRCLTPVRPWAKLTDAEWEAVAPYLAAMDCGLSFTKRAGRPPDDTRARLDAIFRAVTLKHPDGGRGTWDLLPEEFGKADTVSRTYRRWLHRNLWARLLAEVACPGCLPALKGLTYWICCAFRRGIRLMGRRAITLARRLRLLSALPAPLIVLPDPELCRHLDPICPNVARKLLAEPRWRIPRGLLDAVHRLARLAIGRKRITRWMEPA